MSTPTTFDTAYLALQHAAAKVGAHCHAAQWQEHVRRGRSPRTYRYLPPNGHAKLVDAMHQLGLGQITINEAMATLHYGDSGDLLRRI